MASVFDYPVGLVASSRNCHMTKISASRFHYLVGFVSGCMDGARLTVHK